MDSASLDTSLVRYYKAPYCTLRYHGDGAAEGADSSTAGHLATGRGDCPCQEEPTAERRVRDLLPLRRRTPKDVLSALGPYRSSDSGPDPRFISVYECVPGLGPR